MNVLRFFYLSYLQHDKVVKEYFLVFVQVENSVFHMVKDDVVMSYREYKQVINEIEYYLMDNFQKQHEEIVLQLYTKRHFYLTIYLTNFESLIMLD